MATRKDHVADCGCEWEEGCWYPCASCMAQAQYVPDGLPGYPGMPLPQYDAAWIDKLPDFPMGK
jgi:hypothetical protein